jgi:hypothetical protein
VAALPPGLVVSPFPKLSLQVYLCHPSEGRANAMTKTEKKKTHKRRTTTRPTHDETNKTRHEEKTATKRQRDKANSNKTEQTKEKKPFFGARCFTRVFVTFRLRSKFVLGIETLRGSQELHHTASPKITGQSKKQDLLTS